jgi:acetyl esterase/lipase
MPLVSTATPIGSISGGQSSGGHLAAVALTTDWQRQFNLPADIISGMCISGMYDLTPVRLSARSRYVAFDAHARRHASILIQPAWNGFAQLPFMHISQRDHVGK